MSKFNKLLLIWLKGDGQGLKGDTCGLYINRTGQETNRGMSDVIMCLHFFQEDSVCTQYLFTKVEVASGAC